MFHFLWFFTGQSFLQIQNGRRGQWRTASAEALQQVYKFLENCQDGAVQIEAKHAPSTVNKICQGRIVEEPFTYVI
jgi:hypothetical protein